MSFDAIICCISSKENYHLWSQVLQLIHLFIADKPTPDDLQYFLEFQIPREWAPMFSELPLRHQRKKTYSPPLQFSFMSPKLHINSTQVI